MLPGREFLGRNFEDFGALESVASGTGIAERARLALRAKRSQRELDDLDAEEVFSAARQGEAWAEKVIDETVDYLTIAIANLMACFDPEVIILGGGVSRSAEMLVEPILQRMQGTLPSLPRLVVSNLGLRAGVMGAITTVLHNTSNFYVVHKLS
jgi:glucokinase